MFSNGHHDDELEPRSVPKPTQFQEISAKPEVPELSVIFDGSENSSKPHTRNPSYYPTSKTTQETYSEWKNRQNRSPIHKEANYYEQRDKYCYGSSSYSDCDQIPYSRYSERVPYKSDSECHKCAHQNSPTVKDIYTLMQMQSDQIKFLLETIQKLLATVLSNQQNQHKHCCCFENNQCKKNDDSNKEDILRKNDTEEEECQLNQSNINHTNNLPPDFKNEEFLEKKKEPSKKTNSLGITDKTSRSKNKLKASKIIKCNSNNNEKVDKKEKERTFSIASDESFDINSNDVQVIEAPISPDQSIHIEMKSSSEESSNSECEEDNDKKIEVGWTMYKNIVGQVNNLLQDNKSEIKSDVAESVKYTKPTQMSKPKNFELYKNIILPENKKDSSLQMQALAMQYLSPEQAVKFDMNNHFVPTTQPAMQSPNNYSISTLHYMERYHLIAPEKNYTSDNQQPKLSTDASLNKKKKSSRKNNTPSKILNITELRQQPKLS